MENFFAEVLGLNVIDNRKYNGQIYYRPNPFFVLGIPVIILFILQLLVLYHDTNGILNKEDLTLYMIYPGLYLIILYTTIWIYGKIQLVEANIPDYEKYDRSVEFWKIKKEKNVERNEIKEIAKKNTNDIINSIYNIN